MYASAERIYIFKLLGVHALDENSVCKDFKDTNLHQIRHIRVASVEEEGGRDHKVNGKHEYTIGN